ncbi:MAG: HAMP domain-containing histidine kinase [Clostridia bacterium]|nr:HAMP domain-containing histidine kinase [Clostridia bacterium]
MNKNETKTKIKSIADKKDEGPGLSEDSKRHKIIEHEIKNHITVIASLIEKIENYSLNVDFKKDISYIKTALNACENLITASSQNSDTRNTIINVHWLLKETADIFSGNKRRLFKTKLHAKSHLFFGNRDIIKSALNNIIINAVQAQRKKGSIIIKTYNKKEEMYIEIKDKGTGIKAELLQDIFLQGFTTKTGGSGIGLYSVKQNIESCGGRIMVISKEGKGTKFTIILPVYIE